MVGLLFDDTVHLLENFRQHVDRIIATASHAIIETRLQLDHLAVSGVGGHLHADAILARVSTTLELALECKDNFRNHNNMILIITNSPASHPIPWRYTPGHGSAL